MRISQATMDRAQRARDTGPVHACCNCGARLEIAAGVTFSSREHEKVKRLPVWCSTCGEHLQVVYRMSGSAVKVTVEKQVT